MHIAFEQVSYSYDEKQRVWALSDISFTIKDGASLGIVGHTGSGKSTLIRHLNGLLTPTCGRVLIDNVSLTEPRAKRKARNDVGIVFQYPEQQLFAATVYDDVAFGPRNYGLDEAETDARVLQALEYVHLNYDEFRDINPFKLSGGQQRRVALAGILACQPEILVLDEPTAGLDPLARNDLISLLTELHKQGQSMVIVSHTTEDLESLVENVLVLSGGRAYSYGTPSEVLSNSDELNRLGIAAPQAQILAQRLRLKGFNMPQTLYDEDKLVRDIARNFKHNV